MTTETEDLLWIAAQEEQIIPRDIVIFATDKNKTLYQALEMEESDFAEVDKAIIKKFIAKREKIPFTAYQSIFDHMQKLSINMIKYRDPLFPSGLKKLQEKGTPIMIYHQGKKIKFENCIAVVGTRNSSTYAIENTRELSLILAKMGYVIVAGLARGIDATAHRGAISVNGRTIGVLAWIFNPYPPEHERLTYEIKNHGCIISENFFQSSRFDKYKFLQRNAVISGISDVLVAVESSYSGGTRWQVELALSQGKKVIAMEPEISNEQAYDGFTKFVEKGAVRASNPSEVVEMIQKWVPIEHTLSEESDFEEYEVELKLKRD